MIISISNCNTECINMSVCCQGARQVSCLSVFFLTLSVTSHQQNPVMYHIRFVKYCRRLQRWCTSEDVSLLSVYVHITAFELSSDICVGGSCLLVTWIQLWCVNCSKTYTHAQIEL